MPKHIVDKENENLKMLLLEIFLNGNAKSVGLIARKENEKKEVFLKILQKLKREGLIVVNKSGKIGLTNEGLFFLFSVANLRGEENGEK